MAIQYRKFKLLNGNNEEYEFTNTNHKVFANSPSGLGYSKSLSTIRMGDENLTYYSLFNLDDIDLELLFYDDSLSEKYEKYNEFLNFLSYKPLYLLYQKPNSFVWYRRKVESVSLSKSEVTYEDRMLHCDFVLKCLSFWEDNDKNVLETSNQELEGGKVYPITYPITYGENSVTNLKLTSLGMLESPLEITINGIINNPEWVLYDSNDEIYGRGKLIGSFDKVYVNSKETEETITLTKNGLILDNPLGYQDLTIGNPNEIFVTFLKLKTGINKLSFLVDSSFVGSVKVEWRNRYVSI